MKQFNVSKSTIARALACAILGAALPIAAQERTAAEPATPPSTNRDPGGLMDRAAQGGAQVYVDDSFASVERLREAQRLANQGQSQQAITRFQAIVTEFGQKLVYLNDSSYVSITDYVREKLLAMPAVRQGMYDQLFGAAAKKEIDAAIQTRDAATLIRLSDRYYPASAALEGLSKAAEWYFERGEFSAASRTWQKLLVHPMAGKDRPDFLFRAAAAESLARNTAAFTLLRARLEKEFPNATGKVSGQETPLLAALDDIAKMPPWEATDLAKDEWPAFEGGPTRSRLLDVNATIGARLWGTPTGPETPDAPQSAQSNRPQPGLAIRVQAGVVINGRSMSNQPSADPSNVGAFAVLSNGSLFVHTGEKILALSANAGTLQWSFPLQPAPRVDPALALAMQNAYGQAFAPSSHDSVAVLGDQLFAVLPAPVSARSIRRVDYAGMAATNARVVCVNRLDGKEIWSRSPDDIKLDSKGTLSFIGSPTVTRQGVFVMARKTSDGSFTQQYLIRLDRETGNPTWSCYLCSNSTGYMYGNPSPGQGAIVIPTIVDDVVYLSTPQGTDCAVDANVGRILWLRISESPAASRGQAEFQGNPSAIAVQPWKVNPPVIWGDYMIAAADTSLLRIYNRWDGKLLKSLKSENKIDIIAGVVDDQLIVSGGNRTFSVNLPGLNLKDVTKPEEGPLTPEWWKDVPTSDTGAPLGRPFLTAAAYYVPFEKKLVRINPKNGTSESWEWPNTEKDTPGKPGNLLVTSEQVIVVNNAEVAGYSKWETARDNRLAKIKEAPAAPDAYLALAEISFRTAHQDLAQQNMKKSVELANALEAAGNPEAKATQILQQLYRTNLNFAEQLLGKNDTGLRDQSRFYFEQCRAAARDPEQQAEWRLRMAELSLKQKKNEEAAALYSEVLADPALRAASYREGEILASGGAIAEQRLRKLVADTGPQLYTRYEDQAAALFAKARAQRDLPALQQVVESFPNSKASVSAAQELATAYRDKQDYIAARKILWWLHPRVTGDAQARATAELALVSASLKKYPTAAAWALKGQRQFKSEPVTLASGEKVTFEDIKKQVTPDATAADGRLPLWHGDPLVRPVMDLTPLNPQNAIAGNLLSPVETAATFRTPNLLFLKRRDTMRIYDTSPGAPETPIIKLPQDAAAVLLGVSQGKAVVLQGNMAIGVDLKTRSLWTRPLPRTAGSPIVPITEGRANPALGGGVIQINGNANRVVMLNNQQVLLGPDGSIMLDNQGNPIPASALMSLGDPEVTRRAAFEALGSPNFTTARLLNDSLLIVSGSEVMAYNVATGEPAWRDRSGKATPVRLPNGTPSALIGNEDVVVVQVDALDGASSTFYVVDADTGKFRKQIKLDTERAGWRALSDAGTLYVVAEQTAVAYDLMGDQSRPLWRRTDLPTRYAAASALTLDGLMIVDSNLDVRSLSLDSGESRWPTACRLAFSGTAAGTGAIRSTIDGDTVVFQSTQDIVSIFSSPQPPRDAPARPEDHPQLAWKGTPLAARPIFQSFQLSDLYLVEMAIGSPTGTNRAPLIVFRDRKGGKLDGSFPLQRRPEDTDGPPIRAWQVLDHGIALEIGAGGGEGEIHFWRNKQNP